jgi:hypothetical protein
VLIGVTIDMFSFLFFRVGLYKLSLDSGVRLSFPLHAKYIVADAKLPWHEKFKCVKK